MYEPLIPAFDNYPDEAAKIGRLLAGYTQIELDLLNCVAAIRKDMDGTLKAMYRTRGETARFLIADGLGRHAYNAVGLKDDFETAIGAVKHCVKIRNMYSHCMWHDDLSGRLGFVNLEELAEKNAFIKNFFGLTYYHVDLPLLVSQETFFSYASSCIVWVNFEGGIKTGRLTNHALTKPAQIPPPPLHSP